MNISRKILAVSWVMVAVCFCMPASIGAEGSAIRDADRGGSWNLMIPIIYSGETTIDGQNGCRADLNDDFGIGLGAGYNFNDYFQLGGYFNWNSRSYDATVVANDGAEYKFGNTMDITTIAMNGTYYILDKNLTPFVSGAVGYTWVDTNIQNGPPEGYCWWDPWWGYVCSAYVPTKTQSNWSYGLGVGVRYDFNQNFSMQGSYNKGWIDLDSSGTTDFDIWRMDFIFHPF